MDPAYRPQLMRTYAAIKQQVQSDKPTYVPTAVESAFEGKKPVEFKKTENGKTTTVSTWDKKDIQDISDRLAGHVAKNGGSISKVTKQDRKIYKELKHDDYLHIELKDGSDRFIDMTKPIDEVKKKLIEILTGMSGGTDIQARTAEQTN